MAILQCERDLPARLRQAIIDYPNTCAVLVRRHGVYIWGKDWIQAKTQAECYDYLFESALKMHQLGIDASRPPRTLALPAPKAEEASGNAAENGGHAEAAPAAKRARTMAYGTKLPKCVVLDIEGTVAPISFVADVMFPYARAHARAHVESSYESEETRDDIELIRKQAEEDVAAGVEGAAPIPVAEDGNKAEVVDAVVAWVGGRFGSLSDAVSGV
ncbi:hypothetical protein FOA52_014437 [Chlamydomonas sp. UWO 241]|nr:hypothetical protein FOA52_014437 [Chlamydomonas sp. UWO 241]